MIFTDSYKNSERGKVEVTDPETGEKTTQAQEAIRYRVINRNFVKLFKDYTQSLNLFIRPGKFSQNNWWGRKIIDNQPIFKMGETNWGVKGSNYGKFSGFLRLDEMEYNVTQNTYKLLDLFAAAGGLFGALSGVCGGFVLMFSQKFF
jgi:hypothetical protein